MLNEFYDLLSELKSLQKLQYGLSVNIVADNIKIEVNKRYEEAQKNFLEFFKQNIDKIKNNLEIVEDDIKLEFDKFINNLHHVSALSYDFEKSDIATPNNTDYFFVAKIKNNFSNLLDNLEFYISKNWLK